MPLVRTKQPCAILAILAVALGPVPLFAVEPAAPSAPTSLSAPHSENGLQQPANEAQPEFSLPKFIAEVETRNPSLEAMTAAWQAAAQRYPQVISLEDPTFMAMGAPSSFTSNDVESAYAVQLNQKIPWYGKHRRVGGRFRPNQVPRSTTCKTVACDWLRRLPQLSMTIIWRRINSNSIAKTWKSSVNSGALRKTSTALTRSHSRMCFRPTLNWPSNSDASLSCDEW